MPPLGSRTCRESKTLDATPSLADQTIDRLPRAFGERSRVRVGSVFSRTGAVDGIRTRNLQVSNLMPYPIGLPLRCHPVQNPCSGHARLISEREVRRAAGPDGIKLSSILTKTSSPGIEPGLRPSQSRVRILHTPRTTNNEGDRAESNRRQTASQTASGNQHRTRPQRRTRDSNPHGANAARFSKPARQAVSGYPPKHETNGATG